MITARELIQESLRKMNEGSEKEDLYQLSTLGFPDYVTYTQGYDAFCDELTKDMEKYYRENKETKRELGKKRRLMDEIEKGLKETVFNEPINNTRFQMTGIIPFGSSAWGLGMKGDDLDMTVFVDPKVELAYIKEPIDCVIITRDIAKNIKAILIKICDKIVEKDMLKRRKVSLLVRNRGSKSPSITGVIDNVRIEIRISFTDAVSQKYLTEKMIAAYDKFDDRFIPLAAYVQKWQRSKKNPVNTCYWKTVFPNGVHTVLMVLSFMKHFKMLPSIKDKRNERDISDRVVEQWKANNSCEVSLGTLFMMYIHFYANTVQMFDHKLNVVDGTISKQTFTRPIILITDAEGQPFPATSYTDVREFAKLLLAAEEVIRNWGRDEIVYQLFHDRLVPRISFSMKLGRPGNESPEPDSDDDEVEQRVDEGDNGEEDEGMEYEDDEKGDEDNDEEEEFEIQSKRMRMEDDNN